MKSTHWRVCRLSIVGVVSYFTHFTHNQHYCADKNNIKKVMSQDDIDKELIKPLVAQKMNVHKKTKYVSHKMIQDVIKFENDHSTSVGRFRRDSGGIRKLDCTWSTSYLHTNGLIQNAMPNFVQMLVDAAIDADKVENWGLLTDDSKPINIRVIELHKVLPGGALPDNHHHDQGSLVTIDVMCSSDDDFTGGNFTTLEADNSLKVHSFTHGDVLIFPSHKYHSIQPVTDGLRQVLVIEIWRGENRTCAHRCLQHIGPCNYSTTQSYIDLLVKSANPEIDPW
jgi:hypothetical protein